MNINAEDNGRAPTRRAAFVAALLLPSPAGAHMGRPGRQAIRSRRTHQTKTRSSFPPGRKLAQSMSFNFPNELICATGSSARTDGQDLGLNFFQAGMLWRPLVYRPCSDARTGLALSRTAPGALLGSGCCGQPISTSLSGQPADRSGHSMGGFLITRASPVSSRLSSH
jgi:hypothetical protein